MISRPPPSELLNWALSVLAPDATGPLPDMEVVAGDASNRRYFRAEVDGLSRILVDAPPATEKNQAFLVVRKLLAGAGVKVPALLAADLERGYLVLEDLGDRLLLTELDDNSVDGHYRAAMAVLLQVAAQDTSSMRFACYDEALLAEELGRFPVWFAEALLQQSLDADERALVQACFDRLIASALEQPRVLVHRDFHSRNLMPQASGELGVIDFQDAVRGPVTYDLVSVLRDCYMQWPVQQVESWALAYRDELAARGLPGGEVGDATFLRWFDLMGLQRHIKVLGTFARLCLRDGKSAYLDDLPLVIHYVLEIAGKYAESEPDIAAFHHWFEGKLSPVIARQGLECHSVKAMILAAGVGERMRPLTDHTPKPLLQAGGEPLIAHHLRRLAQAGFREVVVNVSHLAQQIVDYCGDGTRWGLDINYSPEPSPLETAGGIYNALPLLGDSPFLVVNGDVWIDYPFEQLLNFTPPNRECAHLVMVGNPPQHPQGDFALDKQGWVRELAPGATGLTYAGVGVYTPAFFAGMEPGKMALRPLLDAAIRRGFLSGEYYPGHWEDVGTPERLQALDAELRLSR